MKDRIITPRGLLCLLAACFGIFSIAQCQSTCPARCLCHLNRTPRTVMCSKQGLEVFPQNISDLVEQLNLSDNLLTSIIDDVNRLIELEYLNLARNKLSSLPDNIRSLKSLQRLDLSGNNILETSHIRSLAQLPSLSVLNLSKNSLSTLEGLISANLEILDASYCVIRQLSNTSLDGLPNLTMLSLVGNPLKYVQDTWGPKLQWLDMSDCLLNYLSPFTFQGFPELEELRLSNNPKLIYSTRNSTLTHLKLKKLYALRCNLDRPGLHGFPSLTYADLSNNQIQMLPDRIFAKNRGLSFLHLHANEIEKLNASTFEGLKKLQVLDLSANNIKTIHPLAFSGNVELNLLNLSYNVLQDFPNLRAAVIKLDLSYNLISHMNAEFLTNLPQIMGIYLNDNQLRQLPSGMQSLTLRNLDLRRNRIVEVSNDTFLQLPQLMRIDLSGNRLTGALDPEMFQNNPILNIIDLDDNPWLCNCKELHLMFIYLTHTPAKTLKESLICQRPKNVSGYTWETACFEQWNAPSYSNRDRTWGFVMIGLLMMVVLCGSFISLRHMMRIKRRAIEQREQLETFGLLSRRRTHPRQEEEQQEQPPPRERRPEPRIHPLELVEPPTYEEAVQMSRLARSLDNLDDISVETTSMRMGSADNLRMKYVRRTRRPKKRFQSEDDLLRREERRRERLRRVRNTSADNSGTEAPKSQRNSRANVARRARRQSMMSDSVDSGSGRTQPRPQTPNAKQKRRRTMYDVHSSDDEDSDIHPVGSSRSIVIRELKREPRSGYRHSTVERDS
ncbi:leucine-rich repeat-containing G-protein coupled receptor 4 [Ceratina calcarata]|uniref:Leucine-rich repeat-containing G-protein coupled receptor 4 n=1 Tax=Ceratina calcarata TaxID=156304 RepID=A0AAJ7J8D0_9HYME|nr:leucine-rich repeat-containing G-protein coupled receptor 4 [Ceratina calcarata]